MPEVRERNDAVGVAGWSVARAEDAEGRPVRVCALTLPAGLSEAGRARITEALNASVSSSAQGRLSLLSWGEQDGALYTVEPAPSVPSLREAVAANGPLSVPALIPVLHGAVAVLAAMEAAGLRHPWLTPDNVYPGATTQLAGQAWPRVLAILSGECPGFVWPEQAYAAPEIVVGDAPDGRAEAWSAAALVAFALTGQEASAAGSLSAVAPAVATAVRRAMQTDPSARYPDVKTMVVDLTVEHAIGMTDTADQNAVPSGGEVPDWARDLLRETDARRGAGRPLVDTAPEAPAKAEAPAARAEAPVASPIAGTPPPAANGKTRKSPADAPTTTAPVFDWDATTPKKSMMPVIVSIIAALFIIAGIALTFLRK